MELLRAHVFEETPTPTPDQKCWAQDSTGRIFYRYGYIRLASNCLFGSHV